MADANHIKRNPVTGAVAIRTDFPDEPATAHMTWLVATSDIGVSHHSSEQVADWEDLYIPGGTE